jgi:hypothetical protein
MACQYCGRPIPGTPAYPSAYGMPVDINHSTQGDCFRALQLEIDLLRGEMQTQRGRAEDYQKQAENASWQYRDNVKKLKATEDLLKSAQADRNYLVERGNHAQDVIQRFMDPATKILNQEVPPNEAQIREAKDLLVQGIKHFEENLPRL